MKKGILGVFKEIFLSIIFAFLIFLFAFLIFLYFFFFRNACKEQYLKSVPAPDGNKKAVIYVFDCGATTDFTTVIKIIRGDADETSGWYWNKVFSAKSYNKSIDAQWYGPRNLTIFYKGPRNYIYKQKNSYKNIGITYNIAETPEP